MDTLPSGVLPAVASGPSWLVSSFRLRARLDFSIPSAFSGQRGCQPRFWIWLPSFGRQRDFNPPEQRAAQRTLPAPPPPSRLPPLSRCFRLYGLLLRPLSEAGRGGLLQLLRASWSSCCRYHPARVPRRFGPLRRVMLPSPKIRGLGLWSLSFRGHLCVHFRYGPMTRSPSLRWLCR
jgi:hypothetical protein